jgi:hypothetical protein
MCFESARQVDQAARGRSTETTLDNAPGLQPQKQSVKKRSSIPKFLGTPKMTWI